MIGQIKIPWRARASIELVNLPQNPSVQSSFQALDSFEIREYGLLNWNFQSDSLSSLQVMSSFLKKEIRAYADIVRPFVSVESLE